MSDSLEQNLAFTNKVFLYMASKEKTSATKSSAISSKTATVTSRVSKPAQSKSQTKSTPQTQAKRIDPPSKSKDVALSTNKVTTSSKQVPTVATTQQQASAPVTPPQPNQTNSSTSHSMPMVTIPLQEYNELVEARESIKLHGIGKKAHKKKTKNPHWRDNLDEAEIDRRSKFGGVTQTVSAEWRRRCAEEGEVFSKPYEEKAARITAIRQRKNPKAKKICAWTVFQLESKEMYESLRLQERKTNKKRKNKTSITEEDLAEAEAELQREKEEQEGKEEEPAEEEQDEEMGSGKVQDAEHYDLPPNKEGTNLSEEERSMMKEILTLSSDPQQTQAP